MRVLVTGHHGYVGSVTVAHLIDAGYEVEGLDTFFFERCDLFADEVAVPARRLDVRDVRPRDVEGFDAVVHLAALSNDPLGDLDPALTRAINFEATAKLADACSSAGVERFLFASSCSMYGTAAGAGTLDESAPLAPLTAYAASKVAAEEALRERASDSFSPVLMRNATVYGVSPRLRLDLVVNNLVGWAYTTGAVRILSDGTPWRPLIHVRDLARVTAALLEAPRELVHAQAFNVGRDNANHQVRDIAGIVRETVPGSSVEYAGTGDPDPRSYRVSFAKLAATLEDFRFEWDVRRGAEELLDAYRRASLDESELGGERYIRLGRLRRLLRERVLDASLRPALAERRG